MRYFNIAHKHRHLGLTFKTKIVIQKENYLDYPQIYHFNKI